MATEEPSTSPRMTSPDLQTATQSLSISSIKSPNKTRSRMGPVDVPSTKYPEIELPNPVTIKQAQSPPRPTLPKKAEPRTWCSKTRERNPLSSGLTGPGRAGKYGELIAESGGRYVGEALAGRPHGRGQFLVPKASRSTEFVLQYEGEWVQGRREGIGTHYYPNGESYTGDWVANVRHGNGRYFYANGDMYSGPWENGKRNGKGTLYYAHGDIFVGIYLNDRREGLGTLYMIARQKKMVAEYVADAPRCGTVLEIEDPDLEPLRAELAMLAMQRKLDAATSGEHIPKIPPIQLLQPNKVLGEQIASVRKTRVTGGRALKGLQEGSGTLSETEVEMLRHSYVLMAGGDGTKVGVAPHQLRELSVMAGLDPAAPATRILVEKLLERKNAAGRIDFDNFMQVVLHFQENFKEETEDDASGVDAVAALEQAMKTA